MSNIEKIKTRIPGHHIVDFLTSNCAKCKYCPGIKNIDEIQSEVVCNYAHEPMIYNNGTMSISIDALQGLSMAKQALHDGSAKIKIENKWSCMDMVPRTVPPIMSPKL